MKPGGAGGAGGAGAAGAAGAGEGEPAVFARPFFAREKKKKIAPLLPRYLLPLETGGECLRVPGRDAREDPLALFPLSVPASVGGKFRGCGRALSWQPLMFMHESHSRSSRHLSLFFWRLPPPSPPPSRILANKSVKVELIFTKDIVFPSHLTHRT